MITDLESARRKYKPDKIKYILIAEAPPREGSGRFFYFESVPTGDSLFLETMKVLYPNDYSDAKSVRLRKREFLHRFKRDGFYLIDSTDSPMEDPRPSRKRQQVRRSLPSLVEKLAELISEDTKIILISKPVYDVCADVLRLQGFNIVNDEMIDFPGSSGQAKYRVKLGRLLNKCGWRG